MSDSVPGGFMSVPPEVAAAMRRQYEDLNAINEAGVRRQDEFIESLDEDGVRMMRGFLVAAIDDPAFGNYMVGWLSSILKYRFKVCQYCGGKHETLEDVLSAHPDGGPNA